MQLLLAITAMQQQQQHCKYKYDGWQHHRSLPSPGAYTENYHGSNTVFLVGILLSIVGFVFVTFTLMALCYRSMVVNENLWMCLRSVDR